MVVRAVVPSGYMLASAESSSARYLTLAVCSGETHTLTSVDLTTGKVVESTRSPQSPHKQQPQPTCVFAASATMAPAAQAASLEIALSSIRAPERPLRDARPVVANLVETPPSTGPPVAI
jgi:hypothetical protein